MRIHYAETPVRSPRDNVASMNRKMTVSCLFPTTGSNKQFLNNNTYSCTVLFIAELCVLRTFGSIDFSLFFLSAGNLSLNFFGTDCAQVFNFPSCPNVRNTHGSMGSMVPRVRESLQYRDVESMRNDRPEIRTDSISQ
eukprot:COSAG02_NODE_1264_length_13544_cov_71.926441_2_plen_138_part_00